MVAHITVASGGTIVVGLMVVITGVETAIQPEIDYGLIHKFPLKPKVGL